MKTPNIVKMTEEYIQDYATLADPHYSLPIALWTIGTFCFDSFDAFPYMVINSPTKRSGKTRLAEMISFCAKNPRNFAALTAATMFRSIETEKPTLLFDEAEALSSEAASTMRAVLNVGYRRGQTVPRTVAGGIREYATYCPKVFVLIGDVYDTLRDRSMVITMRRAETRKRFVFDLVKEQGRALRETISAAVDASAGAIQHAFETHGGLAFLMDRDEEIWTSLFCLAQVFAKDRIDELKIAAMDMATEKTADSKRYITLKHAETAAMDDEYSRRLITDLFSLFVTAGSKVVSTEDAIAGLRAIPVAPWRKFRGDGISAHDLANMLSRFGVRPVRIALGSGRGKQTFRRGYRRTDVEKAMRAL